MKVGDLIRKAIYKKRSGDVIIRRLPGNAVTFLESEKVDGNVLIRGQNNHTVRGGTIYRKEIESMQVLFVLAETNVVFGHTDSQRPHADIFDDAGLYLITQAREVDMLNDLIKVVED
jgi:hypothetical protein